MSYRSSKKVWPFVVAMILLLILGYTAYENVNVVPTNIEDALNKTQQKLNYLANVIMQMKTNSTTNIRLPNDISSPTRTSKVSQQMTTPPLILTFKPWAETRQGVRKEAVKVMDLKEPSKDKSKCVNLATLNPIVKICIHNVNDDIWVSGAIAKGQFWEAGNVKFFQRILQTNPALNVIDIGANLGQYSLIGASMGRKVLAVEARLLHVEMLRHSIQLNKFEDRITLVHNALTDERKKVYLSTYYNNQGGTHVIDTTVDSTKEDLSVNSIITGDLTDIVQFDKAILKIDIEGFENKALHFADPLFDKVEIPYIIMEWNAHKNKPKEEVEPMLGWFEKRGYQVYQNSPPLLTPLSMLDWKKWPFDICFKHKNAKKLS